MLFFTYNLLSVSRFCDFERTRYRLCLVEQPKLTKLNLHGCGLVDTLCSRLLPDVLTLESLRDMDLSNNWLTDTIMSDLLPGVSRLKRLNLAGNKFEKDGLHSLATALRGNTSLEMLDVSEAGVDQRRRPANNF